MPRYTIQKAVTDLFTQKVTRVNAITYVAKAEPGTPEAEAKWRVFKVDRTVGQTVTWADGNDKTDNIATDLTALSYS